MFVSRNSRFVIVCIVLSITLIAISPAKTFSHSTQQPLPLPECHLESGTATNGRTLILLRGIWTSAVNLGEQIDAWKFVIANLSDDYAHFVYFSYDRQTALSYQEQDSFESITTHHIPLLHDLIQRCHDDFQLASFDLMGHSLGGIVATEYIKQFGLTSSQAGWVQHIITLDSPINGASILQLTNNPALSWVRERLAPAGSAAATNMRSMSQNRQLRGQNLTNAINLRRQGIEYWTLNNFYDLVVPEGDGIIDGMAFVYHLGLDFVPSGDVNNSCHRSIDGNPSAWVGHNMIFCSRDARLDIESILGTTYVDLFMPNPYAYRVARPLVTNEVLNSDGSVTATLSLQAQSNFDYTVLSRTSGRIADEDFESISRPGRITKLRNAGDLLHYGQITFFPGTEIKFTLQRPWWQIDFPGLDAPRPAQIEIYLRLPDIP